MNTFLEIDLRYIVDRTTALWDEIRGKRIFITGGTGFLGRWLLESFAWANARLSLNASAVVLTRNPKAIRNKAPHLFDNPAIDFLFGELSDFNVPSGEFSHIIHAAADMDARSRKDADLRLFESIVWGTRRVLEFAIEQQSVRFLFISSGAIYGKQPSNLSGIPEDYSGAPEPFDINATYGGAKRSAELLCASYARQHNLHMTVARGFTFFGSNMESLGTYAIGDFMRDALHGGPIVIKGRSSTTRSYLYAADMAIWLWTILFRGQRCHPYNVGSDQAISILEVAHQIAQLWTPSLEVCVVNKIETDAQVERYVPSIGRAKSELGLTQGISLSEGLKRWRKAASNS